MPRVVITPHLDRYVSSDAMQVSGTTVREVLEAAFDQHPRLRDYILDEQGMLRQHVVVFIDGEQIGDRRRLSDGVAATSEVQVMQALSGG